MENRARNAIVLSIIISGLGQIYLGQVNRGIGILIAGVAIAVTLNYFFGWWGTLFAGAFWIWNIIDAYKLGKKVSPAQSTT